MALNQEYLLSLDVDSLLLTFRKNADLLAPGNPFVGSWEDPACEVRGQFMGHYLSATARLQGQMCSRCCTCCRTTSALAGGPFLQSRN